MSTDILLTAADLGLTYQHFHNCPALLQHLIYIVLLWLLVSPSLFAGVFYPFIFGDGSQDGMHVLEQEKQALKHRATATSTVIIF